MLKLKIFQRRIQFGRAAISTCLAMNELKIKHHGVTLANDELVSVAKVGKARGGKIEKLRRRIVRFCGHCT